MKRNFTTIVLSLVFAFFGFFVIHAQDTFSIVAVDSVTGQVGSAGATCLDEPTHGATALIISDVLPGKGAIHTQSYWNQFNQINARARMEAGDSPEQIMAWLANNDAQNSPTFRQYGAADFDDNGHPRAAAFTGIDCLDYKGHLVGPNYAIQGNILIGPEVLQNMEANFLATNATLAEKLMAAMQGANIPGADSRCLNEGVSSLSAFLRVAKPEDDENNLFLDLHVPSTPVGMEPIDSLQTLFDGWLITSTSDPADYENNQFARVYPNPAKDHIVIELNRGTYSEDLTAVVYDLMGKEILVQKLSNDQTTIKLPAHQLNLVFIKVTDGIGNSKHVEKILISND